MKIGVLSDSHDNLENLNKSLNYLEENNINTVIFCGDFCSPIPVNKCIATFKGEVHAVFGNTEDRHLITVLSLTTVTNLKIYGEYAELNFDNRKIAVTHYPFYANAIAKTQEYDAVFHGHNHTASKELIGKSLLVNPGELLGFKEEPRFGVYNTNDNSLDFIFVKDLK